MREAIDSREERDRDRERLRGDEERVVGLGFSGRVWILRFHIIIQLVLFIYLFMFFFF